MSFGSQKSKTTSQVLTPQQRQGYYNQAMSNIGPVYYAAQQQGYQANPYREYNPNVQAATGQGATVNMQQAQTFDAGEGRSLTGGDYGRLEQQLAASRMAGMGTQRRNDAEAMNQSLANRGIWSSGIAARAENDLNERYANLQDRALSEAAAQRYAMQLQEQQALNQYGLSRAAQNAGQAQFNAGAMNQGALANQASQNQFGMANMNAQNAAALANQQTGLTNNQAYNAYMADQAMQKQNAAWRPAEFLSSLWSGTGGTNSSSGSSGFQLGLK